MKVRKILLFLLCLFLLGTLSACSGSDDTNSLIRNGDSAYAEGDFAAAAEAYTRIIEIGKATDEVYNNRGMCYLNMGNTLGAVADFTEAIALEPESDVYLNNRGLAYFDQSDYENAIADFSKALDIKGPSAVYYANRGDSYLGLEMFQKAIDDYDEALKLNGNLISALGNRANCHFRLGNYEAAAADYSTAIGKDSTNALLYWNRGETYRMMGEGTKALEDYAKFASIGEGLTSDFYLKRAELYVDIEQYENALKDYESAIQLSPDQSILYEGRANIHFLMGDYNEAISDYNRFLSSADQMDKKAYAVAVGNRGYCYFSMQDLENALRDLNDCIKNDPDYAWAYFTRGQIYQALERYEEAKADYDKANEILEGNN